MYTPVHDLYPPQIAVRFGYPENMTLDNIHVALRCEHVGVGEIGGTPASPLYLRDELVSRSDLDSVQLERFRVVQAVYTGSACACRPWKHPIKN